MGTKFVVLALVALMSGCTSIPDSIQVDETTPLVNYQQASANPDANAGKMTRWGGVIARVKNLADSTMLELVHYDLRSYGRPIVSDQSVGRFRVYVDGFLDPMVFKQGRVVTFAGRLMGVEEGAVGEHNYLFPTLKSSGYHLWKDIDHVDVSTIHVWPYHSYWGWPYHPVRQRVLIRSGHHQSSGGARTPSRSDRSKSPSLRTTASDNQQRE
jgi:outer membrane lipoprotein